jgi:hypothetical protein
MDHKILKLIAREAPLAYKAFFGRKYIVPQYRQSDYVNQDKQNEIGFDRLCTFAAGAAPLKDEPWMICLNATVSAVCYNRPTLFLERELGEALMRTEVIDNLTTGDIRWRWPAFRVYLPARLVKIDRQGEEANPRWAAYVDVAEVSVKGSSCPLPIAREIEAFVANNTNLPVRSGTLQQVNFMYKEAGVAIGTGLDRSDQPGLHETIYAQLKPWGEISIGDYQRMGGDLKGGYTQDEADKHFLAKVQHLVLNIMLFLSSTDEYEPIHVLRAASPNPAKPQGELVKARFVGDVRVRAVRVGEMGAKPRPLPATGRHHTAHWVSGHWKRVVYGVRGSLRRLQWIQPYATTDDQPAENRAA